MPDLPPPAPPSAEMPRDLAMPKNPPAEGTTRVVLDSEGEPANVDEVLETVHESTTVYVAGRTGYGTAYGSRSRPVCATPCVVDLTPGVHILDFNSTRDSERSGRVRLQVGDDPKLVRHAMGSARPSGSVHMFGYVLTLLGGVSVAGGASLLIMDKASGDDSLGLTTPGLAFGAAGLGAMLIGIPMMILDRGHLQSGSTTEKTLAGKPLLAW